MHDIYNKNIFTMSMRETCKALGIAYVTGLKNYKETGQLTEGVPVIKIGRKLLVSTEPLRQKLGIK